MLRRRLFFIYIFLLKPEIALAIPASKEKYKQFGSIVVQLNKIYSIVRITIVKTCPIDFVIKPPPVVHVWM